MPKIDYKWLLVGILVGYFVHICFSHPSSPLSGAANFYYGSPNSE